MKKFTVSLMVAVSTLVLGACMNTSAFGGSANWKEEVLLHDGSKIIAERSQTYGGQSAPGSREHRLVEEEWKFDIPGGKENIVWRNDFGNDPKTSNLNLLILDVLNGTPYLAASPAGCISYNIWNRPNPPYVFFKFDGKVWQRISLAEFPAQFKESNVVVGRPDPQNRSGTLSIATIKEENRLLEPHLRVLVREPITKGDGNWRCPEEVYYKGAWVGPGDSIGKRMMDVMSNKDKKN